MLWRNIQLTLHPLGGAALTAIVMQTTMKMIYICKSESMIRYLVDFEGGSRIWDETLLLTEIRMVDVLVTHSEERDTCCRKRLVKE